MRFSRKLVMIGGGILLLAGATGSAAVFIGSDRLLGPSYASTNGLSCDAVQTVNIRKNGSLWVRKFIRTQGGDGTERLKTALRVARAVYDKQKPDLVQVSVLDKNGPQLRSEMRGRAIAAQVVFIPDLAKIPEGAEARRYSAFYYDGAANGTGQFYGLRIDLPLEDTEALAASLSDSADCATPALDAGSEGHDAKPAKGATGHGETKDDGAGGHGGAPAETKEGGAGAEAHDETPSPEAHGEPAADELLTSTPEADGGSIFSLSYLKSLIFGKGSTTAQAAEEKPATENAPAEEPGAEKKAASH
ncbi:hypothetical protein ACTJJ8_20850 [Agrobacterium radiobacter]|uniref:hypothetical protein n=1 Tax=Agrobacterium tumefaciens complex TaxID=1183400 RepID=UPI0013A6AF42|nr:hypothetical protein [Agrobacterium tumefaciens]NSY04137.1 hypothetical protein [Agrobacterium tumefaciens]UXS27593.1 hypothetical protein FY153_22655 [Agrobacterium tumefaciens]UXS55807.1 hypothetical protein FY148_16115 [Agrobacterium tumefaciens]UXS66124.1 hypothetical protein FY147_23080 [Agrobacterium tumefaciens]